MILFHVEALDFDKPDVRSRAWLPACLLRRAGLAARLVEGEVPADLLKAAKCVILTGGASAHALGVAERASAAGVPVILDVGSVDILKASIAGPQREQFVAIAALASAVTVGSEMLARHVEQVIGVRHVAIAPDALEIEDGLGAGMRHHPGATARVAAKWAEGLARDAVARLRRRWPGHALSDAACRRIVWFGASRQPNGEGGVAELLLAASDLADLAEEMPLRLDIVGRSPRTARRLLKQLAIPVAFYRYSPWRARARLRGADLCLLPSGGDPASLARSSARANLASAFGVPVVASTAARTLLPAMRAALADRTTARAWSSTAHAQSATAAWRQAIDAAQAAGGQRPVTRIAIRADQRLRVLFLLQQFQDIDLIAPIAEAASASPDIDVRVAVLSKIAVPASRRLRAVCGNGGTVEFWHGADLLGKRIAPARFAVDVAVTASEGLGVGARFARAFVVASRSTGARAVTLQHGLDNGGLTFGPRVPPHAFNADLVLTWGGPHRLTEAACGEIKDKAVPVGCPKRVFRRSDFPGFPYADRSFIAVFENLHWRRYSDDYRKRFVSDLAATAESSPDTAFVVKPHMGGRWFTRQGPTDKPLPANVKIADPEVAQWRRFTADAFLAHASAVITTPSTIALDAARYGVPVALVAYGISAQNYVPLPRLERTEDWLEFLDQARCGRYDRAKLDAFFADAALPGDAVARILTVIKMAGARRSKAEILSALRASAHGMAAS
ncbi:MAG TPA: hypothetical protein VGQ35_17805 [Dongiaceae bacterium]|jgi:hypothetical protein|nr:hypothetical protein [Dongiaceae bacterium]